jgi:GT2 family glycosyltransferase/glycosyltransferase involved in cell wall biosynthesis
VLAVSLQTPRVSVVVVNFNGKRHLEPCFSSLLHLDYPPECLELLLVDNGSTDGSLELIRRLFPTVKIVENGENLGFARANNIGVRHASGELVATLNNDMRVDERWLRHMVAALDRERGVVCAGSAILSWDGRRVDFMGGRLNFTGHGLQPDYGAVYRPVGDERPRLTPFACGGAMLIDRQTYLAAGGFDEDYFAFFEDVDLGWRLWLMGYQVALVPAAVVYHRHHGTARRLATHKLAVLYERNALSTMIKNFDQQTLEKALPAALLLLMERGLRQGKIDQSAFSLSSPASADAQTSSRLGLANLVAAHQVIEQLPQLMAKREAVQALRQRSEAEIFRLWNIPLAMPTLPGSDYLQIQHTVVAAMGLDKRLATLSGRRVLIVAHEAVGARMSGPAIRYWEIARALAGSYDVRLAHPDQVAAEGDGFAVVSYSRGDYRSLAPQVDWADVVLAYGYVLVGLPELADCGKPLVVDLYDIFLVEELTHHLRLPAGDQERAAADQPAILQTVLQAGDFFLCSSERQRDFWLGTLAAQGRINPRTLGTDQSLRSLIDVVPFGLPAAPPTHARQVLKGVHPKIAASDKVLLWGGGLWDWFDPLTLIKAMAKVREQRTDVKLYFLARQHYSGGNTEPMLVGQEAARLARELAVLDECVFFGDWVPYADRANYLLEADLGVSLHSEGLETHFAFRTRLLDYIWAGLPILATEGDTLGDLAAAAGLGRKIPAGDVEAVAGAILSLLAEDDLRVRLAPAFAAARERMTWERAVAPLVGFLQQPRFAPDHEAGRLLSAERRALRSTGGIKATPYVALPLKALRILREGGWSSLRWEIGRYLNWWKLYRH